MVFSAGLHGPARLHVLVAEEDAVRARQIAASLAAGLLKAEVEIAASVMRAEQRLRGLRFSALIAGDFGDDAVTRLRPLISGPLMVLGHGRGASTIAAMQAGAD